MKRICKGETSMDAEKNSSGMVYVLSGPSGSGKTTIYKQLLDTTPRIRFSVSCTTREPRPGEQNGRDYYFLSATDFEQKIGQGEFLEYATVHGHYYGTLQQELTAWIVEGTDVLLDIDTQGAKHIRSKTEMSWLKRRTAFVFIAPPSFDALEQRLRERGTDSEDVIEMRLENARQELAAWRNYDYLVVNDQVEEAVKNLSSILHAARCRTESYETPPWQKECPHE